MHGLVGNLLPRLVNVALDQQPHGLGRLDADERKGTKHEDRVANNPKGRSFSLGLFNARRERPGF